LILLSLIRRHWLPLSALTLSLITTLSLWPMDELPAVPGGDKLHHYIAYAALMFPASLRRPRHWLWIALFFLAWSGAIELIQPYVNRYGEWLDLAANAGGLTSGLLLAMVVNYLPGKTALNRIR